MKSVVVELCFAVVVLCAVGVFCVPAGGRLESPEDTLLLRLAQIGQELQERAAREHQGSAEVETIRVRSGGCPETNPCKFGRCSDAEDPYGLGFYCHCSGSAGGLLCQWEDVCRDLPCPADKPDCFATNQLQARFCYPPEK